MFWDSDTPFRSMFDQLDLADTVELACGHGRHAAQIVANCGHLTLVDVFKDNLVRCQERLESRANVSYLLGDGYSFRPIPDASATAVFCYDAMVHFSPDLVESYVDAAARILKPGGQLLLHLSNYNAPDDRHYGLNPQARNRMTAKMFADFCTTAGFEFVENLTMAWGGIKDLDRLALCRKLARA
ncbi:MAG: class I SAM-dependent methyltransferase [Rhizobiales bacterium]|nr:class I SAM-dependent methyltransferase [Hyphomicrobiales bacterium]MBI3672940.1 class I SAM-dependent methyltransferase [Hyphomicrobiales bacterium]